MDGNERAKNRQEFISSNSLISRNKNLHYIKRKNKTLLIEPETASWAVLDEKAFSLFQSIEESSVKDFEENHPSIEKKKLHGFLKKLYRKQCIAINGEYKYNFLELWERKKPYPHFFSLHITEKCNLRCRYCYNSKNSDKFDITSDTAKYIIKRLLLEIPLSLIKIEFHGGEPLLLFNEIIVPSVEFGNKLSHSLGKRIEFLLQTNGSLITKEIAGFIDEKDINTGISMDGYESLHNRNRIFKDGIGSFSKICEGISNYKETGRNISLLTCIDKPDEYSACLLHYIKNNYFDSIIRPAYPYGSGKDVSGISKENAPSYAYEFLKTVDIVCNHNIGNLGEKREKQQKMIFRNLCYFLELLISKNRQNMCYKSPCGAGNGIIGISTEGDLFPCEELIGKDDYKIGSIFHPENIANMIVNSEPYKILNRRTVEMIDKCKSCCWRRFCGGGCISKIVSHDDKNDTTDYYCDFNKIIFEELIWKITDDPLLPKKIINNEYFEENIIDTALWDVFSI